MTRRRSIPILAGAAVIPLTALAAGCGGGGGGGATAAPAAPVHTSAPPAAVHVANSRLGKIMVDSRGRTLYLFQKDSRTKSACSGMCASFWPPLRTNGKPTAGTGARASLLGTISRSDGKSQATYNGHPLYTFVMDKKAGDTNGEGKTAFGGRWFAISAAGKQISAPASKSSGSSSPQPAAPPAPKAAPQPAAPQPAPKPAAPKPAPKPAPPANNGIPQNGGGDGDSDNNGGPDDGDGGV